MDKPKGNRIFALARLAIFFVVIFVVIVSGYIWWITRPVTSTVVTVLPSGTETLLVANARHAMMPDSEIALMPGPLRILSRAHRFITEWSLIKPDKDSSVSVQLPISIQDMRTTPPIAVGANHILAAHLPDQVLLLDHNGTQKNKYVIKNHTVRAISASPDGNWIAFSVSRSPMMKTVGREPGMDPYNRQQAAQQNEANPGTFRLFISDGALGNVKEINVAELFPALGPCTLAWTQDSTLLFSGYMKENHRQKATFVLDPHSGSIRTAPGHTDWGPVFALSPDGATAAAVGREGLILTDTATGEQRNMGSPSERVLPAWDPQGRRIAFAHHASPSQGPGENATPSSAGTGLRIVVLDPDSGDTPVESKPVKHFTCGLCRPYWSPDGTRIFINGTTFDEQRVKIFIARHVVLCFDLEKQSISFPTEFESLWK